MDSNCYTTRLAWMYIKVLSKGNSIIRIEFIGGKKTDIPSPAKRNNYITHCVPLLICSPPATSSTTLPWQLGWSNICFYRWSKCQLAQDRRGSQAWRSWPTSSSESEDVVISVTHSSSYVPQLSCGMAGLLFDLLHHAASSLPLD